MTDAIASISTRPDGTAHANQTVLDYRSRFEDVQREERRHGSSIPRMWKGCARSAAKLPRVGLRT
jgi:hypothetical protein